jgi:hypothetical protein
MCVLVSRPRMAKESQPSRASGSVVGVAPTAGVGLAPIVAATRGFPPASGVAGRAVKLGVPAFEVMADLRLAGADEGKTELGVHVGSFQVAFTETKMS